MLATVRTFAQRRVQDWARRRQGPDDRRVVLGRRRLYILPTRQGLLYGITVFVMLLGSMNYSNSMGFMLTFVMAALGLVALHATHSNLLELELTAGKVMPVFAGETAHFHVIVSNPGRKRRCAVTLGAERDDRIVTSDVPALSQSTAPVPVLVAKRGWQSLGRLSVETTYPLGLFRAWSWIHMEWRVLVYPAPAMQAPPLPPPSGGLGQGRSIDQGEDDFSGLRDYQPGDSPRRIAWKSSAREEKLLTKRFSGTGEETRWLDWESITGLATESRLSVLCRWVLQAHHANLAYGLSLPGTLIEPDAGDPHRDRCLAALALHDLKDAGA